MKPNCFFYDVVDVNAILQRNRGRTRSTRVEAKLVFCKTCNISNGHFVHNKQVANTAFRTQGRENGGGGERQEGATGCFSPSKYSNTKNKLPRQGGVLWIDQCKGVFGPKCIQYFMIVNGENYECFGIQLRDSSSGYHHTRLTNVIKNIFVTFNVLATSQSKN